MKRGDHCGNEDRCDRTEKAACSVFDLGFRGNRAADRGSRRGCDKDNKVTDYGMTEKCTGNRKNGTADGEDAVSSYEQEHKSGSGKLFTVPFRFFVIMLLFHIFHYTRRVYAVFFRKIAEIILSGIFFLDLEQFHNINTVA